MQMMGRMAIAALLGAVAGAAVLWERQGWPESAPRQIDRANQPTKSTATLMPPPETLAKIFEPCAHCHEIGEGAHVMTGPPLTGIIGRKAASYPHYPYSRALRDSGIVWDAATLARFIADSQAVAPGTRMIFPGLSQKNIDALVSYIASVGQQKSRTSGQGAKAAESAETPLPKE